RCCWRAWPRCYENRRGAQRAPQGRRAHAVRPYRVPHFALPFPTVHTSFGFPFALFSVNVHVPALLPGVTAAQPNLSRVSKAVTVRVSTVDGVVVIPESSFVPPLPMTTCGGAS